MNLIDVSNLKRISEIPEFELYTGYYVSPQGKIYSDKYGPLLERKSSGRIGNSNTGSAYERVSLSRGKRGEKKTFSVHQLVALAFKYRPDWKELTVDHIDENTQNNSADNLEWVTMQENIARSKKKYRKFTHEKEDEIARRYAEENVKLSELAEEYSSSIETIWNITRRNPHRKHSKARNIFTKEQKLDVVYARKSGKSAKSIAENLGISQGYVFKILKEHERGELNELS